MKSDIEKTATSIKKPEETSLSAEDCWIFEDAIENPPEPNEKLKLAARKHHQIIDALSFKPFLNYRVHLQGFLVPLYGAFYPFL